MPEHSAAAPTATDLATPATILKPFGRNTLLIVGAPRSGTTVLLNALNAAQDMYLLGEPNFATDTAPGFAARYRAFHRSIGNLPNKSTDLPPLLVDDPAWWHWLAALAEHHRYVGAKLVLNPDGDLVTHNFEAFAARLFYRACILFVFRNPLEMAHSVRALQGFLGEPVRPWTELFRHFNDVVRLYLRMATVFPQVRALVHEDITEGDFARLGRALGCDLSASFSYYRLPPERPPNAALVPPAEQNELRYALTVYRLLREVLAAGPALPQADQNTENARPDHRTGLGRLAMLLDPMHLARMVKSQPDPN